LNRSTPADSPTILAAVSDPHPDGEQRGRQLLGEFGDLDRQGLDARGEFGAPMGEFPGEPGDQARLVTESAENLREGSLGVEAAGLRLPGRVEFVQVPTKSADQPGSFCHKGFAMIDQ